MTTAAPVFDCTQCARCCRNLLETKAKGLPAGAEDLAQRGVYLLPRVGGLQAWAWEAARMREAAARLGVTLAFQPSMGLVVAGANDAEGNRGGAERAEAERLESDHILRGSANLRASAGNGAPRRFVTLVYELTTNACPLVRDDNLCGAYEERPTVCRAYPLLLVGSAVTISTKCPGHVDVPIARIRPAYGSAARAVEYAHHLPQLVGRQLAFLESTGAFASVRGLAPAAVAELPRVDLLPFLDEIGARAPFVTAMDEARAAVEG